MEATGKKTRKKLRTNCEVIMGRNLWKKLGIEREGARKELRMYWERTKERTYRRKLGRT